MKELTFVFFGICMAFYSCDSKPEIPTATQEEPKWIIKDGWKAENNDFYFIQFPQDWSLIEFGTDPNTGFSIVSPKTVESDSVFESVVIYKQRVPRGTRIDYFGAKTVNNNQFQYGRDYKLHRRELILGDNNYYRIDATLIQEEKEIRGIQHMLLRQRSVFVLTLYCTSETFEEYQEVGEEIMKSFIPKEKFWIQNVQPYI